MGHMQACELVSVRMVKVAHTPGPDSYGAQHRMKKTLLHTIVAVNGNNGYIPSEQWVKLQPCVYAGDK